MVAEPVLSLFFAGSVMRAKAGGLEMVTPSNHSLSSLVLFGKIQLCRSKRDMFTCMLCRVTIGSHCVVFCCVYWVCLPSFAPSLGSAAGPPALLQRCLQQQTYVCHACEVAQM